MEEDKAKAKASPFSETTCRTFSGRALCELITDLN